MVRYDSVSAELKPGVLAFPMCQSRSYCMRPNQSGFLESDQGTFDW
jgi:hypothetical protein